MNQQHLPRLPLFSLENLACTNMTSFSFVRHRKTTSPAPPYHRAMNKSAIINCRWTIRPVRSDGQSLLGKDGKEVSNLDYVYLEQVCPGGTK